MRGGILTSLASHKIAFDNYGKIALTIDSIIWYEMYQHKISNIGRMQEDHNLEKVYSFFPGKVW